MYNSKLVQLYLCLNNQEKSQLKKWIKSPIHNSHEDVAKLLDILGSKRKVSPKTTDRKKSFRSLYGEEEYDDLRMRHVMGLAVVVVEEFVCFFMQKREAFSKGKNLIQFYRERKLDKFAQQHIQKIEKKQTECNIQDGQYYYHQYELEQAIFEQAGEQERMRTTNLQEVFDTYSIAFIIETLRNACTALSYQNLNKKNEYKIPFLESILQEIEDKHYEEIVAIQFYYNSYMSLTQIENACYFHELKKLLFKNSGALQHSELKNIHVIAFNFCIKKLNTGAEEYVQEVFDLFKYGLEYNVLLENNTLSRFTYKNIVTAALRLKKTDWTNNFIQKYTPRLEPKYQKNYHHFAHAKLLFTKGEYAQTMTLLHKVEYDDLFLNIDAKMILVKIYYEGESVDALDSLLSSFYVYLQRKEIMGYHQSNYKNIIKFTRKLLYLAPYDKMGIRKLKEQIEATNPLTERAWLLEQISKLDQVK
jgi:hypothetical protein